MKKELVIDPAKNKDSFNYVNCFEKPLGLILGNCKEELQIDFFLLLKLLQGYQMESFEDESLFYTIRYNEALAYIFEEALNIEMIIEESDRAHLHQTIKKHIDQGRFALVPGNLKLYPEGEYYKEYDWKHLFLVNGYNEEEAVWYICDNTHEEGNDGSQYLQRTIDFELLESLFGAAGESFGICSVWSIDIKNKNLPYSEKELFMNVLDLYLYNRCEQPYKELEYINTVLEKIRLGECMKTDCEGEELLESIEFILIRTIRYKEFFYQKLICKLHLLGLEESIINKIKNVSESITAQWMGIANSILIHYHIMKEFDMEDSIIRVIAKEKEMFRLLSRVKSELEG